jgi:hypothetical protein
MSGRALVRNPESHPPAAEQDQWVFPGAWLFPGVLTVQTLDAEDEFERARR